MLLVMFGCLGGVLGTFVCVGIVLKVLGLLRFRLCLGAYLWLLVFVCCCLSFGVFDFGFIA